MNNLWNFCNKYFLFFLVFIICSITLIPLINISFNSLQIDYDYLNFLKDTSLVKYFYNSFFILFFVILLTFFLGVSSAYLVFFCNFTGVKFFRWSLILSLAVPPYIYAFSLSAFFEFYGTGYSIMSFFLDSENIVFFKNIPPILGTIISLTFTLFGYVYILSYMSFSSQSQNLIEVGLNLGFKYLKIITKIILPLARPSIFIGLSLVAMETLSDYGTVSFFGVNTLTTGIYDSWFIFDDLPTANILSVFLLFFILLFFIFEKILRGNSKFHIFDVGSARKINLLKLNGIQNFSAFLFCSTLFFVSFLFPLLQMLSWTIKFPEYLNHLNLLKINLNTLKLVIITAFILVIFSFICNYGVRVLRSKFLNYFSLLSISGYAIPGILISVSIISFISYLDSILFLNLKSFFIGTILGLIFGYILRFYSISFNGIKTNYQKINYSVDEASYLLGYKKFETFTKIHLPFLSKNLLLILILIGVEILKELPITLILRPFNFETFSTTAFTYASQDLIEASALPSLFLILWTSIFIILSLKYIFKEN